jgi:hypothetical protein
MPKCRENTESQFYYWQLPLIGSRRQPIAEGYLADSIAHEPRSPLPVTPASFGGLHTSLSDHLEEYPAKSESPDSATPLYGEVDRPHEQLRAVDTLPSARLLRKEATSGRHFSRFTDAGSLETARVRRFERRDREDGLGPARCHVNVTRLRRTDGHLWMYPDASAQDSGFVGRTGTREDVTNRLPKLNTRVRFPSSAPRKLR